MTDFRLICGWRNHVKAKKLRRRCGADGLLSLTALWEYCAVNRPAGDLTGMDDEEIEIAADWPGEPGELVAALTAVGYLEGDVESRQVHDWSEHQPWIAGRPRRQENGRIKAQIRWHKNGRHTVPDAGCPLCTVHTDSNAGSMHDACNGQCSVPDSDSDSDSDSNTHRSEPAGPDPPPQAKRAGPPPECRQILDSHWLAHAPLPASSQTTSGHTRCLEAIRLLHEADGLEWPEVARIVEYGAKVWQPAGWMLSPAKLRSPTKSGECKVWEAIKGQISGNGQPKTYTPDFRWKDQLRGH